MVRTRPAARAFVEDVGAAILLQQSSVDSVRKAFSLPRLTDSTWSS